MFLSVLHWHNDKYTIDYKASFKWHYADTLLFHPAILNWSRKKESNVTVGINDGANDISGNEKF